MTTNTEAAEEEEDNNSIIIRPDGCRLYPVLYCGIYFPPPSFVIIASAPSCFRRCCACSHQAASSRTSKAQEGDSSLQGGSRLQKLEGEDTGGSGESKSFPRDISPFLSILDFVFRFFKNLNGHQIRHCVERSVLYAT